MRTLTLHGQDKELQKETNPWQSGNISKAKSTHFAHRGDPAQIGIHEDEERKLGINIHEMTRGSAGVDDTSFAHVNQGVSRNAKYYALRNKGRGTQSATQHQPCHFIIVNLHAFIKRNGGFAQWDKADPDDRRAMWLNCLTEFPCEVTTQLLWGWKHALPIEDIWYSSHALVLSPQTLTSYDRAGHSEEQAQYHMWATTMFDIMCEAVWMYRIQPNMDFLKTNQTVSGQRETQQNKQIFAVWKTMAEHPRILALKMRKQVDD
ncbi:hypothetical protein LTR86_009361 [Recurvomyces mirabilis]|nr:hypothetical protein LTR86_009361 [Recurvomyces mirabilis]